MGSRKTHSSDEKKSEQTALLWSDTHEARSSTGASCASQDSPTNERFLLEQLLDLSHSSFATQARETTLLVLLGLCLGQAKEGTLKQGEFSETEPATSRETVEKFCCAVFREWGHELDLPAPVVSQLVRAFRSAGIFSW